MTIVHINSIDLNNNTADSNGSLWYVESLDGWDSPSIRSSTLEPPSKHGVITSEGLYGPRNITVAGICKATSKNNFYVSDYYLQSQTNYTSRLTTFVFSVEEDVHRRCQVLRAGPCRTRPRGQNTFEFQVTLRADDPFKYSVTEHSEGLVASVGETLANAGTARSYPVITLTASGTPTITVGSYEWRATDSLASGVVIDMKKQTVKTSGGVTQFDKFDLTSEWLFLEPGNNTVESSVACTVTWRDAWV